jgi:DNA adenine methylase
MPPLTITPARVRNRTTVRIQASIPEVEVVAPQPVRPPLKWAGGKRWQLPHLLPHWQRLRHRRLVEPFCGGLGACPSNGPDKDLFGKTGA